MSLASQLKQVAQQSLRAIGDLAEDVTWRAFSASTYTPATGAVTRSETTATVKVFFGEYRREEIDGVVILLQDKKLVVAANDLGSITPHQNDRVTRSNGEVWELKHIEEMPGAVGYLCQVRR